MSNVNIKKLCKYLTENKANHYQIENAFLSGATDFIKNGYLKMLAVILQQSEEITDSQLMIFKRILAGAKTDFAVEDYLRMALEIEVDDFIKFAAECKELPIKYRFILDAMILSGVSGKNEEQINLIADFCEFLAVDYQEVKYLANMAKAILSLNAASYVDTEESKNNSIPSNVYGGYIRLLPNNCIFSNSNMTIFQPTCTADVTVSALDKIKDTKTPCVKLVNVKVSLADYPLVFEGKSKVIIEGCEFKGGDKYSLKFNKCETVIIRNSSFESFSSRTIELYSVASLKIYDSNFMNCIYKYYSFSSGWPKLGGVIYSDNNSAVDIDGCEFENCGGKNGCCEYRTAFISNGKCNVNNSKFINCWHHRGNINTDSSETMFTKDSKATNCVFENSANFS